MALAIPPLAVDLEPILGFVVMVLMLLAGLYGQVQTARKAEQQRRNAKPGGPAPRRNVPESRETPTPEPAPADEMDEFLRRVEKRRSKASGRPVASPPPQVPPAAKAAQSIPLQPADRPIQAALAEPGKPSSEGVAEHVRRRMGESQLSTIAPALGQGVAQSGRQIEQHLQSVFQHQVGRLAGVGGESAEPQAAAMPSTPTDRIDAQPAVAAVQLAALFADPTRLRQVILIGEILHRPEERWS